MQTTTATMPAAGVVGPRRANDAVRLSDKDVEFLYGLAYNFYSHGRCGEAAPVFAVLTMCDPMQPRFWLGLGECRQKQERYEEALAAYGCAFGLGNRDYRAALHIAECMFAMRCWDAAAIMLNAAESSLGDGADCQAALERITALRRAVARAKADKGEKQPNARMLETATAR